MMDEVRKERKKAKTKAIKKEEGGEGLLGLGEEGMWMCGGHTKLIVPFENY